MTHDSCIAAALTALTELAATRNTSTANPQE
jgi:hypothetical protein